MEAALGLGRMKVFLCLLFAPFTALSDLSIVGPPSLTVQTGEDVWLTCLIRVDDHSLDVSQLIVHWSKNGFDKAIFNGTPRYGPPGIKLSIEGFPKGNASLFLPSVRITDQGLYVCDIQYAKSKAQHYINLKIQAASESRLREERDEVEERHKPGEKRENMEEQTRPGEKENMEEQPRSRKERENTVKQPGSRKENETVEEQHKPSEEETVEELPNLGEEKGKVEEQEQHQKERESWDRVKWYLQVGMVLGILLIGLLVAVVIAFVFEG
uniref:Uncharacterized protein LOC117361188 n=1 Tax=Geotrypetes seraphini TaxID=260995 RepID=A0A6P8RHW4_GEOSA|nr:uncharacterized protein LOC117361188 [Geotrypetes seraphini]